MTRLTNGLLTICPAGPSASLRFQFFLTEKISNCILITSFSAFTKKAPKGAFLVNGGSDETRTRDLRRDRATL